MKHTQSIMLALICAIFTLPGCGTLDPSGTYKGDKLLYQSELAIPTAYDLIHTYVQWESDNRALLTRWPEIKQSADYMRINAPLWFATANALHDAYASVPSEENHAALKKSLSVLRAAMAEAAQYMSVAANK